MNGRWVIQFWCGLGKSVFAVTLFTGQLPAAPAAAEAGATVASGNPALRRADSPVEDHPLHLRGAGATAIGQQAEVAEQTSEAIMGWTLDGPYFLRSADPLDPGELELKFVYGFETSSDDDDEHEFEFVLEWGMVPEVEFILEAEVELGEGKVEGNGDISRLGFHTRFWEEDGWLPAFAMRNLIRVPTGYRSDGVDYVGRGLFTKTIIPDTMRLHFNPFLQSINGNLEEDERNFRWGAALGIDYRVSDDLLLIADYLHQSSEEQGARNQHSLELGADWEFAHGQLLGLQTEFELDGDGNGADFGCRISYILELPAPRLDRS